MTDLPTQMPDADDGTPAWLRGLIARHGQPDEVTEDAALRRWNWLRLGRGVQIMRADAAVYVDAWMPGRDAGIQLLESEPTDADISAVVALAGLDECDAKTALDSDGAPVAAASDPERSDG